MTEILRQKNLAAPEPIEYKSKALEVAASPATRPPAPAEESPSYWRHLASAAQNSRLPGRLPSDGAWEVRWRHEMGAATPANSILRHGNRVLVQAGAGWILLDDTGQQVSSGRSGRAALAIDASASAFYVITPALALEARTLDDGELQFQNALPYNESYAWPMILRNGSRMLAFANQMPMMSHQPRPPERSVLQLLEIGTPLKLDEFKLVRSLTRFEVLHLMDAKMLGAATSDTIYLAGENLIVSVSTGLELKAAYTGTFKPLLMSVDGTGWMHLFLETSAGRALWVVSPDGQRVVDARLDADIELACAPVIGYDRRIYIITPSEVLSYSPQGVRAYRKTIAGSIAGAGITIDGTLLVCAGSEIFRVNASGESARLFRFEGERLITPPVYTSHREILAATDRCVYCVGPK